MARSGSIIRGGEEAAGSGSPAAGGRREPPLSAGDVCKCLCAISVIAVIAFVVVSLTVLLAYLPAASSVHHPGTIVCRSEIRHAGTDAEEETEPLNATEPANSTEQAATTTPLPAVTGAAGRRARSTTDAPVRPEEVYTGSPFGYRTRGQLPPLPVPAFV